MKLLNKIKSIFHSKKENPCKIYYKDDKLIIDMEEHNTYLIVEFTNDQMRFLHYEVPSQIIDTISREEFLFYIKRYCKNWKDK